MRLGKTYRGLKRIPLHTLICNPQQKQTRVRSVLCCHSNEKGSKAHKSLPAPSRHNPTESGYELLHNQLHEHTEGEEITCTLSSTTRVPLKCVSSPDGRASITMWLPSSSAAYKCMHVVSQEALYLACREKFGASVRQCSVACFVPGFEKKTGRGFRSRVT
jgi:hypothetical protein